LPQSRTAKYEEREDTLHMLAQVSRS